MKKKLPRINGPNLAKFEKKILQNHWANFSTKPGTKHSWVKAIQVCSNEGLHSFPRGYNNKLANIH